jgi:hypothetical protein
MVSTKGKPRPMTTGNINRGSQGFRVTEEKYRFVREAILSALPPTAKGLVFLDLVQKVKTKVRGRDDLFPKPASVMWYTKVVQLDLEKRGLIERVPDSKPQRLRRLK